MMDERDPARDDECDRIEIVNRAEELLLRPRAVARRMQEKLLQVMAAHDLLPPHGPAPGRATERVREGAVQGLDEVREDPQPHQA